MPGKTSKRFIAPDIQDPDFRRVVEKIYDDMNELASAVATSGDETSSRTSGDGGDTRVINDRATSRIVLQGRTKDGWVDLTSVSADKAFDKISE